MPLYSYQALDQKAKKKQGVIEAQNQQEAKNKLRERGLMVKELTTQLQVSSKENINKQTLVDITHQLGQLVNAGVPLYQSLLTIEEQYRNEKFHRILLSLCDQIKGGTALSDAMKTFPKSFDQLYCSMIEAGEASGSLGLVLNRLTELLKKEIKLKKDISTAMIYPSILALFSLLVIGLLLGFVVPSIEGIFEGRELNRFTEFVLGLSRFFRNWWIVYVPIVILITIGMVMQFRSDAGREKMEKFLLRIPLIKKLIIESATARFTRTLATLLQGGVPLIEGLRLSKGTMRNRVLEEEISGAEQKILEGSSLSKELKKSRYIPSIVPRMVTIGEDTGNSVGMLNSIADMYEDSLEKTLSRVVALAQPVILIIMGGIIGLVMVAILLPLSDITSFGIE